MDFPLGYLKPRQDVLARHQHERTLQPHVVGIQAVSFRLFVCRESAAPDAVQLTQPATKAAVEVLGLHTVQMYRAAASSRPVFRHGCRSCSVFCCMW